MAAAGRPCRARRIEQRQPDDRPRARTHPHDRRTSTSMLRAAAARAVAALPLPLGLLEYFASDSLPVSAPVLAAATLDPDQWRALLRSRTTRRGALSRRFIPTCTRRRRSTSPTRWSSRPGQRITRRRHAAGPVAERGRRPDRAPPPQPNGLASGAPKRSAAPGTPSLFRWECGPSGEIAWVDGAPRGPLVGRSIARANGDGVDQEVVRAFAIRAPFRDAAFMLAGEGWLAGEWRISGVPEFEPADGRFAGYRGVALRDARAGASARRRCRATCSPTPIRFASWSTKSRLRSTRSSALPRSSMVSTSAPPTIVTASARPISWRQARVLLTAIDDLDFAAKVHSSAGSRAAARQDRRSWSSGWRRRCESWRRRAASIVDAPRTTRDVAAAIEPELADRLIFRTCARDHRTQRAKASGCASRSIGQATKSGSRSAAPPRCRVFPRMRLFGAGGGTSSGFFAAAGARAGAGRGRRALALRPRSITLTFARA